MHSTNEQNVSFTLIQSPSQANGYVAVVSASNSIRTDFGTAYGHPNGTSNTEHLIEQARKNALQNLLHNQNHQYATPYSHGQPPNVPQVPAPQMDKTKHNGGGSKPISTKQVEMIEGKCRKLNFNPDTVCQSICNKSMHSLCGADADAVIKHLMKQS